MKAKTERFELRLDDDLLDRVDDWRMKQGGALSRAEAVRQLTSIGLAIGDDRSMRISDAERLIISLLCDTLRAPKSRELDTEFIAACIDGGHHWALKWEYPGVFPSSVDDPLEVTEVVNTLDMWSFMEEAFEQLDAKSKQKLAKDAEPFGKSVQFIGWDGNNECNHRSIGLHLVNKMNRFQRFKGRDLNSHMPKVQTYRAMTSTFEKMRPQLGLGRPLSVDQIVELLKTR